MRRITRTLVAVLAVSLVVSGVALAQVDTIQFTPADNGNIPSVGETGSDYHAQPFDPNGTSVQEIGVHLVEESAEGEVRIGIAPDDGAGNPDVSSMLFVSDIINPGTTGQWFNVSVTATLTQGETYYLVVDGFENSGATGSAAPGESTQFPGVSEGLHYSGDGGSTWDVLSDRPMAVYIGYGQGSTATPTPTPTDGNETSTPIVSEDKKNPGEIWESFLVFVAFIILVFAAIGGLGSRSMAFGAVAAYPVLAYIAIQTANTLLTNILYVTLTLIVIGMAFKMWRAEFGGQI